MNKYRQEMQYMASRYAKRPDVVQGAGGNMSVKIGKDILLVKASGREFGEVNAGGLGIVPVRYKLLKKYLGSRAAQGADESAHLKVVRACIAKGDVIERPSMEVWFHTLLPKYVLHTHSVYVNVLACSDGGAKLFDGIMRKADLPYMALPYCNPGFELGNLMIKRLNKKKSIPTVIFLENHGIIVTANSAKECVYTHDRVEIEIKKLLGIKSADFSLKRLNEKDARDFESLVLFPDQIIYPERADIRAAHRFILRHIRNNGLRVRAIPSAHVSVITNMESEKHRKSLSRVSRRPH